MLTECQIKGIINPLDTNLKISLLFYSNYNNHHHYHHNHYNYNNNHHHNNNNNHHHNYQNYPNYNKCDIK